MEVVNWDCLNNYSDKNLNAIFSNAYDLKSLLSLLDSSSQSGCTQELALRILSAVEKPAQRSSLLQIFKEKHIWSASAAEFKAILARNPAIDLQQALIKFLQNGSIDVAKEILELIDEIPPESCTSEGVPILLAAKWMDASLFDQLVAKGLSVEFALCAFSSNHTGFLAIALQKNLSLEAIPPAVRFEAGIKLASERRAIANLTNLGLEEEQIAALLMIMAAKNPEWTVKELKTISLREEHRFSLGLILAENWNGYDNGKFPIKDLSLNENNRAKIAITLAVNQEGDIVSSLKSFALTQEQRFRVLRAMAVQQGAKAIAGLIPAFDLTPSQVDQIAQVVLQNNWYGFSLQRNLFSLTSEGMRDCFKLSFNEVCLQLCVGGIEEKNFSNWLRKPFVKENLTLPPEYLQLLQKIIAVKAEGVNGAEADEAMAQVYLVLNECVQLAVSLKFKAEELENIIESFKKYNDVPQVKTHVLWLISVIGRTALFQSAEWFQDKQVLGLFSAISKLSDPALMEKLTQVLIDTAAEPLGKQSYTMIGKHASMAIPLLEALQLPDELLQLIITMLNRSQFKDSVVLESFFKLLSTLTTAAYFSKAEKVQLLSLLFAPLAQLNKQAKTTKIRSERAYEELIINTRILNDLLLFKDFESVLSLKTAEEIAVCWSDIAQKWFKLTTQEEREAFLELCWHKAKFPGLIATLTAKFQSLRNEESKVALEELHRFVSQVIQGTFLDTRYNKELNRHLQIVLKNNPELEKAWKESQPIPARQLLENHKDIKQFNLIAQVKEVIAEICSLPEAQSQYPLLYMLHSDFSDSQLEEVRQLNLDANQNEKGERAPKHLLLQSALLELLNPNLKVQKQAEIAQKIQGNLPDNGNLKSKVQELRKKLQFKVFAATTRWMVRDTDHWEDLLGVGMGTYSCKNVQTASASNLISLMAYILDGKLRPQVVEDEGTMLARSMTRLMSHNASASKDAPILFVDPMYEKRNLPAEQKEILKYLIVEGCKHKARRLKVLLAAWKAEFPKYVNEAAPAGVLCSLGGVTQVEPYGFNRFAANGEYSIPDAFLIDT